MRYDISERAACGAALNMVAIYQQDRVIQTAFRVSQGRERPDVPVVHRPAYVQLTRRRGKQKVGRTEALPSAGCRPPLGIGQSL